MIMIGRVYFLENYSEYVFRKHLFVIGSNSCGKILESGQMQTPMSCCELQIPAE